MGGRDERHVADGVPATPRRRWRRLPVLVVLLVLGLAVGALETDAGPRWLGWNWSAAVDQPSAVPPPPGIDLPPLERAGGSAVADPVGVDGATVDRAAVAAVVAPFVARDDMGGRLAVAVAPLGAVEPAYAVGPARFLPASTTKVLTAAAALSALGPDHTFRTRVLADAAEGRVVLVGGGDPFLAREQPAGDQAPAYPTRADLRTLATATAQALRTAGRTRVRVDFDASLFAGDRFNPAWPDLYRGGTVAPISALWVDSGRPEAGSGRVADPPRVAAEWFARSLRDAGIRVPGRVRERAAAADAAELAAVTSAPLEQIVERVLDVSDNEGAEVLAHHVALARDLPATFEDAATAVADELAALDVPLDGVVLTDGSGLSRRNRLTPASLLGTLAAAVERPELRAVLTGLPVAGATGSLALRFDTGAPVGQGVVRAKTGTLTGVHGLAGTLLDANGTPLAFVAIADRVTAPGGIGSGGIEQAIARQRIDELAAALAACTCSTRS